MPIQYSLYHPEWKTRIRPDILARANNCCEICGVPNYSMIYRGIMGDNEFYMFDSPYRFLYETSSGACIGMAHYFISLVFPSPMKFIKVILTIAHLDHDINNNEYDNLKALCQLHHLRHDVEYKKNNRKNKKQCITKS